MKQLTALVAMTLFTLPLSREASALEWTDVQQQTDVNLTFGSSSPNAQGTFRYLSPDIWSMYAGVGFSSGDGDCWVSPRLGVTFRDNIGGILSLWSGTKFASGYITLFMQNDLVISKSDSDLYDVSIIYEALYMADFHPAAGIGDFIDINIGPRVEQVHSFFWLGGQVGVTYGVIYAELAYLAAPQSEIDTHNLRFSLIANLEF